ncbi:non-hydrolyzing UDP-N-acetylglucosamine 2-epimerase [Marinilabilia salmonicolor]|uniref:UDP-N-acetylglucosamine 2-epimerase (Non-hydrolysing) n=1 Tax=Marinilabilia salmonicolor TaxID=989 RepID=A0A368UMN2_9BACT|nr:UDP-N-acetylglucosamine 2-epimerase (non-hydrolyzing) [Marinilabilia salmonicolor]RCW30019.1 UDP-N-acetylglucosamine 2-epimerase (non-hydrolysing) [Marinilabilia salmonicolor]
MQKIILVAGARPNFVKIAPLWRAFSAIKGVEVTLVHTGQHYDDAMSKVFFEDLGLPEPEYNLNVGSGSQAGQTADIMTRFDQVLDEMMPHDVIVVGDVNSTLACSLVSVKRGIRTSHVEAGLRSFDRSMPEEINRLATDAISDLLFVSEPSGIENLKREGVADEKVHFVGNVMIDSLVFASEAIKESDVLSRFLLESYKYVLVTIHRPSNVDHPPRLRELINWLKELSSKMPVVFPVHPRTRNRLVEAGLDPAQIKQQFPNLKLVSPQGYIDFQKLVSQARLVITDSGGLQEETTWLGVPCVTLRENTERPVTIEQGTNYLAGFDFAKADDVVNACLAGKSPKGRVPDLWDGHAAQRIVDVLLRKHKARNV